MIPEQLEIEKYESIYAVLGNAEQSQDETAKELAEAVLKSALKYTKFRMDWYGFTREQKLENDKYRSSAHNAFMDNLTICFRYLKRTEINLPDVGSDRKELGDLANYLAFRVALTQR